jgi:mannose-6-phosphate isomerase-like protein (cupin superfamily)
VRLRRLVVIAAPPDHAGHQAGALACAPMAQLIEAPVRVEAAGEPPKLIDEFAGRAAGGEERVSVARMRSPAGWSEPGQRPEFDEYTVVLAGTLRVDTEDEGLDVRAGQGVLVRGGEWVRYSTPEGAEYVAVCLPAFSPETVHRDAE